MNFQGKEKGLKPASGLGPQVAPQAQLAPLGPRVPSRQEIEATPQDLRFKHFLQANRQVQSQQADETEINRFFTQELGVTAEHLAQLSDKLKNLDQTLSAEPPQRPTVSKVNAGEAGAALIAGLFGKGGFGQAANNAVRMAQDRGELEYMNARDAYDVQRDKTWREYRDVAAQSDEERSYMRQLKEQKARYVEARLKEQLGRADDADKEAIALTLDALSKPQTVAEAQALVDIINERRSAAGRAGVDQADEDGDSVASLILENAAWRQAGAVAAEGEKARRGYIDEVQLWLKSHGEIPENVRPMLEQRAKEIEKVYGVMVPPPPAGATIALQKERAVQEDRKLDNAREDAKLEQRKAEFTAQMALADRKLAQQRWEQRQRIDISLQRLSMDKAGAATIGKVSKDVRREIEKYGKTVKDLRAKKAEVIAKAKALKRGGRLLPSDQRDVRLQLAGIDAKIGYWQNEVKTLQDGLTNAVGEATGFAPMRPGTMKGAINGYKFELK